MLEPGIAADAAALPLTHSPVPDEQVISGLPTAATAVLAEHGGVEVGVWELTAGTVIDTEVDEVFVVIAGKGTLRFDDNPAGDPPDPIDLAPGVAVRLVAGMKTTWTITETLRKVWVA